MACPTGGPADSGPAASSHFCPAQVCNAGPFRTDPACIATRADQPERQQPRAAAAAARKLCAATLADSATAAASASSLAAAAATGGIGLFRVSSKATRSPAAAAAAFTAGCCTSCVCCPRCPGCACCRTAGTAGAANTAGTAARPSLVNISLHSTADCSEPAGCTPGGSACASKCAKALYKWHQQRRQQQHDTCALCGHPWAPATGMPARASQGGAAPDLPAHCECKAARSTPTRLPATRRCL